MPQRHQDGTEDQIDALGRVSNALVLFNTRYVDAAVNQLIRAGPRTGWRARARRRAAADQGVPTRTAVVARVV